MERIKNKDRIVNARHKRNRITGDNDENHDQKRMCGGGRKTENKIASKEELSFEMSEIALRGRQ